MLIREVMQAKMGDFRQKYFNVLTFFSVRSIDYISRRSSSVLSINSEHIASISFKFCMLVVLAQAPGFFFYFIFLKCDFFPFWLLFKLFLNFLPNGPHTTPA